MAKREISNERDAETRRQVGEGLRRVRQQRGLTQIEVAARAKCTQSSVNRAENGDTVSADLLSRIANALLSKPTWGRG